MHLFSEKVKNPKNESEKLLKTINIELEEALNRGEIRQMKAKWGIN